MNRGHVLQGSPYVQQLMAGGNPNWWSLNNMSHSSQPTSSPFLAPPHSLPPHLTPSLYPQFIVPPAAAPPASSSSSLPISSSWIDGHQELPESWSQLLLGGLVGEEDKASSLSNMQIMSKKIQNWEEDLLQQNQTTVDVKQENSMNHFSTNAMYGIHHGNNAELFQTTTSSGNHSWSQMMPVSSPNSSCVTTLSSTNNILNFSSKFGARHPPPSHSSECNSAPVGGVAKKARVQPSTTQSTFKVRKEKLGDRITALHQIVSPFGKTDTASVLLEAIGYIRFLQNQIEALSLPYLDSGSGNLRQQHVKGDMNCLFPEDPGQLLNDGFNKKKGVSDKESDEEEKKDLRSRGLCLVPVPYTMQVGCDNGADYWGPAAFNGSFR